MAIKRILIAQPEPTGVSPYADLVEKYNVKIDFQPFVHIQGLSAKEFRAQRIDISKHTAVVFTARTAVDHYFRLCEEMRIVVPETMKYFCMTDTIANYLQKYIVYRKRKIFYGNGTITSVTDLIGPKHKGENFLLALADNYKPEVPKAFEKIKLKHTNAILYRTVNTDLSGLKLKNYHMLVFYSPAEIKSLFDNFPDFKQNGILLATFGSTTAKVLKEQKLTATLEVPTPEAPSMSKALELYFKR